jgi:tetratricopeptide (TPR) repeat protein
VLLEDVDVPEEWTRHLVIDCRGEALPEGSRLERILYSVAGLTPPASSQSDELATAAAQAASANNECAALWRTAESLINMGRPAKALGLLPAAPVQLRTKQLRALAMAKTGDIDGAIAILEQLRDEGNTDSETLGLLAGRYRQKWENAENKRWFIGALDTYRKNWAASGDPYPGVNAAAMLVWDGRADEAATLAAEVAAAARQKDPHSQWGLATLAECALIQKNFAEAARLYRDAVARNPANVQALAAMRRNARRTLNQFPGAPLDIEALLPVPRPVAFVGHCIDRPDRREPRFPERAETRVQRAIQDELKRLEADFGVSSASDGADILFIETLLARGGSARVILPCPRGQFAREFVAPEWVHRFRRILAAERVEIIEITGGDPQDLWADFRPVLKREVEALARRLDHTPLLVTIWDGKPGYVAGTVEDWREMGWELSHLPVLAAAARDPLS